MLGQFLASEAVETQIIEVYGLIAVAIITTFGVIMTALLNRTRQHAKAAKEEVKNSHDLNLRDDLDLKFRGMELRFDTLSGDVGALKSDVGGVKADVGGMKSDIRGIRREQLADREATAEDRKQATRDREHLRILEQTLTPAQVKKLTEGRK